MTLCALAGMLLGACTIDSYEKGEGEYSRLTADMVLAHVDGSKRVDNVVTDEGRQLTMTPPATAEWIEKADTTYRALLYYNVMADSSQAEAVSLAHVGVLQLRDSVRGGLKTDPLFAESMWLSRHYDYLNIRLRLMTGETDNEHAQHVIGLLCDTVASTPACTVATLYHDQGGCPEYYSAVAYASIPLAGISTDSLLLRVHTYQGIVERRFSLSK